ncbi:MAG: hypothetical protein KatS3mg118_2033 [Paracoccaceae bacterium]|nr:MAG: hypothetical protein D6686_11135 [Alphaproteobacteria bacterium]GIX14074.1 MAG: hypothetical protein KatS3mg118_2033 [Paracoccaceae bacterium]
MIPARQIDTDADHVRMAERVARAYGLDAGFREALRALRVLLHIDRGHWVHAFVAGAEAALAEGPFDPLTRSHLIRLMEAHAAIVAAGRFGAEHVASAERIAAFFADRPISPLGLAGAWGRVQQHLIRLILTSDRMDDRLLRRDAYSSLSTWMLIETALLAAFLARQRPQGAS